MNLEYSFLPCALGLAPYASSFWGITTSIGNLKMLRLNPYTIQQKVKTLELKYGSY